MQTTFYHDLLTAEDRLLYAPLLQGLQERSPAIRIPAAAPPAVNRAMRAVLRDHPELAWTIGQWSGSPERTSLVIPDYTLQEPEIRRFQAEFSLMAEELRGLQALPELQRVRWIYDFLLENLVYDLSAPHSQDAYGPLVEGRAVCRGIAKAVQLMLGACGLDAVTVEGSLDGQAAHVWNVVFLSGGSCHLDLTMGYPIFSFLYTDRGLPYSRCAAFCVSDETLRKTHAWDADSLPLRCPRDLFQPGGSARSYV